MTMQDPIAGTESHEAWAKATTTMKKLEPVFNQLHLLHAALSLGQSQMSIKNESPFNPEQKEALTKKYYDILITL